VRSLLIPVRDAAKKLGLDLDHTLGHLNDVLDAANQMLEDSRQETFELIKALLSDDPNQAGLDSLKSMARDRVKEMLSAKLDGVPDEVKGQLLDMLVDRLIP
jgi:hypothetical protein